MIRPKRCDGEVVRGWVESVIVAVSAYDVEEQQCRGSRDTHIFLSWTSAPMRHATSVFAGKYSNSAHLFTHFLSSLRPHEPL